MYSAFEDLHASSKINVAIIIQFPVGHFLPGHLPFYTPPPRLKHHMSLGFTLTSLVEEAQWRIIGLIVQ